MRNADYMNCINGNRYDNNRINHNVGSGLRRVLKHILLGSLPVLVGLRKHF